MCRNCLRQSADCQKYRQHKIIKTMNETGGTMRASSPAFN